MDGARVCGHDRGMTVEADADERSEGRSGARAGSGSRSGPLKLKLQFFCGDEAAFGPGRADVLEAIEREGSISGAGRALGMSYRRTWLLVDSMNRCFREKLVETASDGAPGRGARVSEAGRAILAAYRALQAELVAASRSGSREEIEALLRDETQPPGG